MNPLPNPVRKTQRQSLLRRLAAVSVGLLAWAGSASAQTPAPTPELYFRAIDPSTGLLTERLFDASSPTPTPAPTPRGRLPVLFVHGHDLFSSNDSNRNYTRNWQRRLGNLPSFMETLDRGTNAGLGIEDYYIRFQTQGRSIAADAAEIGAAIELILHRHDPDYPAVRQTTHVQVVIIAYSKGTISTRLYLKNLAAEGRSFRPISEFIAISPPNHGLNSEYGGTTCAGQQLMNGFDENCTALSVVDCSPFPNDALGFFRVLNGHPMNNTARLDDSGDFPTEAPGSRPDLKPDTSPNPPTAGTLYVTLFAAGNSDFVGGTQQPSGDCQGRRLAKNLSLNAVNIDVPGISGGIFGAAGVHANTVHTPKVICQALYAAVHHRSPMGQTCIEDSDRIPEIPPPPRAAAMLTLDFSGSMRASACEASNPGCPDTRASVLKDAVDLFVHLWSAVSVPSDSIGVTYFRTNVTQFPTNGSLLPLEANANAVIADVRGQSPSDSTAMGGGLQRSIETLGGVPDASSIRRVILFTDGMQNVNPMVQDTGTQLVIANQPSPPAVPLSVLGPALGIAVDTIGIGAADLGMLQDIAGRTGGHFLSTTDPAANLRQFFVEELINALKGFSPQLVAYRRGSIGSAGSSKETFAVESGPHRVVLKLSWKQGDSMDFSVTKDGVDVTSAGRFISGTFYKIFVIDVPKKGKNPIAARGNWEIRIKGKKATAYETAAIVDGGGITYDAVFHARQPKVGEPLDLIVRSTAGGKPIAASARVTATMMIPTIAVRDLIPPNPPKEPPAFEPGMTMAERQLLALPQDVEKWAKLTPKRQTVVLKRSRNGAFTTRLRPQVPGIYTAVVTIDGETTKIGKFSRTMTATTVVRTPEAAGTRK